MTEDDWGFDADFARTAAPLLDALYTTWWRVRAHGLDHVPAAGPALVVANQAGGQPWDAAMLATASTIVLSPSRPMQPPFYLRLPRAPRPSGAEDSSTARASSRAAGQTLDWRRARASRGKS